MPTATPAPPPTRKGPLHALLGIASFFGPIASAEAVTQLSVFVSASAASAQDLDGDSVDVIEPVAESLDRQIVASVSGASANSSAQAGYGWARAATSTQAVSGEGHRGLGGAQGRFRDDLVISAPGLEGTPGTLVFQVQVAGSIAASAAGGSPGTSASSSWNVTYQIASHPSTQLVEGRIFDGEGGPVVEGELGGGSFASAPIGFTFGASFPLSVALNVEAASREGAIASAQFSNALEWEGLVEVRSGGQLVTDFVVTSGSGADWAGPITAPEAGPGAVALAALASLAALRRRTQPD
jgi:MYXO-CTERM domain-containing protein